MKYSNMAQFYMVFIHRYSDLRTIVRVEAALESYKAYRNGAGQWSFA